MKKKILFLIFFAIGLNLFSQPAIKIFAFEQQSLPGIIASGVTDENGNPQKKAAAKNNYFIFLSFRKTCRITPVQILIRKQAFSIRSVKDTETPVEYVNNTIPDSPEKIILVPKTNNQVLEVSLAPMSTEEPETSNIQKLSNKNELVVGYLWKKKKYFIAVKRITKLEPVVNE